MTHDANRTPGSGGRHERHAIGVTRMCLNSGSVQLPFALSGALPEGELLVHDEASDEPLVLWSEPPRRLAGLGPFFERHEVQVNDRLVLDLAGDDLRLTVAKRPRRSRPAVTPSTWHSLRDEPSRVQLDHGDASEAVSDHSSASVTGAPEEPPQEGPSEPPGRLPRGAAPPGTVAADPAPWHHADLSRQGFAPEQDAIRPPDHDGDEAGFPFRSAPEDDMPRAPRVKVKPLGVSQARAQSLERNLKGRLGSSDRAGLRGPIGGLLQAARGLFGRTRSPSRRRAGSSDADEKTDRPDWTSAWDDADGLGDDPVDLVQPKAAPMPPSASPDERASDTSTEDAPTHGSEHDVPENASPAPPPSSETAKLPSGVPIRAERFLGGDLRTRLLRFLASPDMPLIAKAELVAKRFDLDGETAAELLADIADDPPAGLRLTPVRAGAWRIERTLDKS